MFITFEGMDGSGKTTAISLLLKKLINEFPHLEYVLTREPGGKDIKESERIREMLLDPELSFSPKAEAFLYTTSRIIHLDKVVRPALEQNKIVFCDRFVDSFYAYQGYGRNLGIDFVKQLTHMAIDKLMPQITFFFNITPLESAKRRNENNLVNDRLELEDLTFHNRVYDGYIQLIKNNNTNRYIMIDATQNPENVAQQLYNSLMNNSEFKEYLQKYVK